MTGGISSPKIKKVKKKGADHCADFKTDLTVG